MVGSGYTKFANQYGMKKFNGVLYGSVHGYMVTLSEGMGYKEAYVCATFSEPEKQQELLALLYAPEMARQYRLQAVEYSEAGVLTLNFHDNPGTLKRIQAFFHWFFPQLAAAGARGMTHCSVCGQEFGQLPGSLKFYNGVVLPIHPGCARSAKRESAETAEAFRSEQKQYGRGLAGGILGGIIGAIPWAIIYYLGYFAGLLGLLIGIAVKKGYELLGGKSGRMKFWIILIISVLAVLLGQFLGETIVLAKLIADGDLPLFTYSQIPGLIIESLMLDAEYLRNFLLNLGLGMLFACVGVFGVLKDVKQESTVKEIEWQDVEPSVNWNQQNASKNF